MSNPNPTYLISITSCRLSSYFLFHSSTSFSLDTTLGAKQKCQFSTKMTIGCSILKWTAWIGTFVTHFFSRNAQWVVQIFGQVGTLPFDVVSGPGIKGALGHGIVHGRNHVSALLPEASRNERQEKKHYEPSQTWGNFKPAHTLTRPFSQIAKQPQTAPKYTAKRNTHVNEAGAG